MQNLHIDGLKLTVPYLYKPHNRHCYHYRRTVPKDLQAHLYLYIYVIIY